MNAVVIVVVIRMVDLVLVNLHLFAAFSDPWETLKRDAAGILLRRKVSINAHPKNKFFDFCGDRGILSAHNLVRLSIYDDTKCVATTWSIVKYILYF